MLELLKDATRLYTSGLDILGQTVDVTIKNKIVKNVSKGLFYGFGIVNAPISIPTTALGIHIAKKMLSKETE